MMKVNVSGVEQDLEYFLEMLLVKIRQMDNNIEDNDARSTYNERCIDNIVKCFGDVKNTISDIEEDYYLVNEGGE
jgi:hypothetical protein